MAINFSKIIASKGAEARIPGLPFVANPHLLQLAFTHPSVNKKIGGNFERLEFLGDALYGVLIDLSLLRRNDIGLNDWRQTLAMNRTAAIWSCHYELPNLINTNVKISAKSKADVFESFIGCLAKELFSDAGNEKSQTDVQYLKNREVWRLVLDWFSRLIELTIEGEREGSLACSSHSRAGTPISPQESRKVKNRVAKSFIRKQNIQIGSTFFNFAITGMLYENYPMSSEGRLTMLREEIYKEMKHKETYYKQFFKLLQLKFGTIKGSSCSGMPASRSVRYFIGAYLRDSNNYQEQYQRLISLSRGITTSLLLLQNKSNKS